MNEEMRNEDRIMDEETGLYVYEGESSGNLGKAIVALAGAGAGIGLVFLVKKIKAGKAKRDEKKIENLTEEELQKHIRDQLAQVTKLQKKLEEIQKGDIEEKK